MDASSPAQIPGPQSKKPRSRRRLLYAGAVVVLLVAGLATFLSRLPQPQAAWLKSAPVESKLIRVLRNTVGRLVAPVVRRIRPRRLIEVDGNLLFIPPHTEVTKGLGSPVAASANGFRAWVLTLDEVASLNQRFQAESFNRSTNKIPERMMVRQGFMMPPSKAGGVVPNYDITPTWSSSSVDLLIRAMAWPSSTNSNPTTTNRLINRLETEAYCRASIPIGYGVLIGGDELRGSHGDSYWYVVSPLSARPMP